MQKTDILLLLKHEQKVKFMKVTLLKQHQNYVLRVKVVETCFEVL